MVNIKNLLFGCSNSHKNRKVINSEAVILAAKQSGYKYEDIANLCGVSKTMVSNWGNGNLKQKPTYTQIEPLINKAGPGLFKVELEPLSTAAIATRSNGILIWLMLILIVFLFLAFVWFTNGKPCYKNWNHCKQLKWYEILVYGNHQLKKELQEFKEYRLIKNHNNETHKKANK